jgi:hypothetical protein
MKFYLFSKKVMYIVKQKFEDTKDGKSKDRHMATIKRINDDLQNTTQKLKIERHESQKNQD